MRRFLLILTAITFSVWSQPTQQQAQPPIVVQVQMPPTNPWMHLVELVVPGIIGAGLALFGVWLTNKYNAATNAANRQHQLHLERMKDETAAQAKSRDNRWEFLKEVYVNLLNAATDLIDIYAQASSYAPRLSGPHSEQITLRFQSLTTAYKEALSRFLRHADVAPLALADEVAPLVSAATEQLRRPIDWQSPEVHTDFEAKAMAMKLLGEKLQTAGRKDLWGTPEVEAKAGAATLQHAADDLCRKREAF